MESIVLGVTVAALASLPYAYVFFRVVSAAVFESKLEYQIKYFNKISDPIGSVK